MRIVRDGNGNSPVPNSVAAQKSEADLARLVVAFNHRDFANVLRGIKNKIARLVALNFGENFFRDDAARLNPDDVYFVARQIHFQTVDGKIFHSDGAANF